MFLAFVCFGMDPQTAVELPRFAYLAVRALLERYMPVVARDGLAERQLDVTHPRDWSSVVGSGAALAINSCGLRIAGADPQRNGHPIAGLSMTEPRSYSVTALERGLQLLQILADEDRQFGLQEIVVRAGLPKTTVFRLLTTLEANGFVERTAASGYRVGLQLIRVGQFAHAVFDLRRISQPNLDRLHRSSSDTVNLGAWRHDQAVYVEVLPSPLRLRFVESPGTVAPLHASALGKAIAAHLPEAEVRRIISGTGLAPLTRHTITALKDYLSELERVRACGYAVDREETDIGAACIGAPLFDSTKVVGGISLSAPVGRMTAKRVSVLVPGLIEACGAVSQKLGAKPWVLPARAGVGRPRTRC